MMGLEGIIYTIESLLVSKDNKETILDMLHELNSTDVRTTEINQRRQEILMEIKNMGELKVYEQLKE